MIDTHTHLNFRAYDHDRDQVIKRALEIGIERMIVVGTDVKSSKSAVDMTNDNEAVYATAGIHPHHVKGVLAQLDIDSSDIEDSRYLKQAQELIDEDMERIAKLADNPQVVGIGETGLDYHVYSSSKYSKDLTSSITPLHKSLQKYLLQTHIKLAMEIDKSLVVHSRQAYSEVLETIIELRGNRNLAAVFHCFDGSKKYLRRVVGAGFYVSFTGNITFIPDRAEVAKLVPLDRLLLETDSPYMTPAPLRGERNEPANVRYIAQFHADCRGITVEEVIEQTTANAKNLFAVK